MTALIQPSLDIFTFNTLLTSLSLGDLREADAQKRPAGGNSIVYVAGHMLGTRIGLCQGLGLQVADPWKALFEARCTDGAAYPRLAEMRDAWSRTAEALLTCGRGLSEEDALKPHSMPLPGEDRTVRGMLTFFAWHDSYHLGQIGFLRTALGYPSVQATFYRHSGRLEEAQRVEERSGRAVSLTA